MNAWTVAIAIWALLLGVLLLGRWRQSENNLARSIHFDAKSKLSPEQLFGCLLSGNFALLMRDNLDQLASALPERRIRKILSEHWGIASPLDTHRTINDRLHRLSRLSPAEEQAIAAWRQSAERHRASEHATRELRPRIERISNPGTTT